MCGFKQSNVMTHKLLELLQVMDARSALDEIGGQLNTLGHSIGRRRIARSGIKDIARPARCRHHSRVAAIVRRSYVLSRVPLED